MDSYSYFISCSVNFVRIYAFVTWYLLYSYFLCHETFKNQNSVKSQWLEVNGTEVSLICWKACIHGLWQFRTYENVYVCLCVHIVLYTNKMLYIYIYIYKAFCSYILQQHYNNNIRIYTVELHGEEIIKPFPLILCEKVFQFIGWYNV